MTAPVIFGREFILPCVTEYLEQHADVDISTLLIDRNVNLLDEGMDLGFRIGRLRDSSLQARPLGQVCEVLCASPAYLKQHGVPAHPRELANHRLILSRAAGGTSQWRFERNARAEHIRLKPRLIVNSNDAAIQAASQGFGITRVLSYQVARLIQAGQLQAVLSEYAGRPRPVHLLHHEGRHARPVVRGFIDLVVQRLHKHPSLTRL